MLAFNPRPIVSSLAILERNGLAGGFLDQYHRVRLECAAALQQSGFRGETHIVSVRTPRQFTSGLLFWETQLGSQAQLILTSATGRRPNLLDFENPFQIPVPILSLLWLTNNTPLVRIDYKRIPDSSTEDGSKVPAKTRNECERRLIHGTVTRRQRHEEREDSFWVDAARNLGFPYLIQSVTAPLSTEGALRSGILDRPIHRICFGGGPNKVNSVIQKRMSENDVRYLGDLVRLERKDFNNTYKWKVIGEKALRLIEDFLASQGLRLGMDVGQWCSPYRKAVDSGLL